MIDEQLIEPLLSSALDAMREWDAVGAEQYLKQALQIEPNNVVLHYNLSQAYEAQGRSAEAAELVRQVHQRCPDYLFGKVRMAKYVVDERQFEAARDLLMPLLRQQKFHYTEFSALAEGFIHLLYAEAQRDGAKQWLALWESVAEDIEQDDAPRINHWDRLLNHRGLLGNLLG